MLDVEGLLGIALLVLWVYCIFDVIASESSSVRNLPKMLWLLIVLLIPDVGAIAWLLLGRPERAGWRPGDTTTRAQRPAAPRWTAPRRPRVRDELEGIDEAILERDRRIAEWEQERRARDAVPDDGDD